MYVERQFFHQHSPTLCIKIKTIVYFNKKNYTTELIAVLHNIYSYYVKGNPLLAPVCVRRLLTAVKIKTKMASQLALWIPVKKNIVNIQQKEYFFHPDGKKSLQGFRKYRQNSGKCFKRPSMLFLQRNRWFQLANVSFLAS